MFLNRQVKSRSAVKLKNAKTDRTVIVAISTDAGCIRYAFLIGKRIGDIVQIGECEWEIVDICNSQNRIRQQKKLHRAVKKAGLLTHPIDNKVHFVRYKEKP